MNKLYFLYALLITHMSIFGANPSSKQPMTKVFRYDPYSQTDQIVFLPPTPTPQPAQPTAKVIIENNPNAQPASKAIIQDDQFQTLLCSIQGEINKTAPQLQPLYENLQKLKRQQLSPCEQDACTAFLIDVCERPSRTLVKHQYFTEILQEVLLLTDNSRLEAINTRTGQALLHRLTPYNQEIVPVLIQKKVDLLNCRTVKPDKHLGSTFLHNMIGVISTHSPSETTVKHVQSIVDAFPAIVRVKSYSKRGTLIDLLNLATINPHRKNDRIADIIEIIKKAAQQNT